MRGRPFVKGQKAWNYNRSEIICIRCSKHFMVSPNRALTAKYCSRLCQNRTQSENMNRMGENNPGWKGGIQTYRQYKKEACERCDSIRFLLVHHKDRNRYNNVISNLETLCKSCHQIEHKVWNNLPKNQIPWNKLKLIPCIACGKQTKPRLYHGQRVKFCSHECYLKNQRLRTT